jgi:hypothetical protein
MQDIFGQVHWRTLQKFDDKKAPESSDAGAFSLPIYSAAGCGAGCGNWASACARTF